MKEEILQEPSFHKVERAKEQFNFWAKKNLTAAQIKEASFILQTYSDELVEYSGKCALYMLQKGTK